MSKLIAVAVTVFLAVALAWAGPSWLSVLYAIFTDGAILIIWIAAAIGIGRPILTAFIDESQFPFPLILSTAAALGWGAISLLVLGLGLAGWLNPAVAWAIVTIGAISAFAQIWRHRQKIETWSAKPIGPNWVWLLAMIPAGTAAVAALLPPGFLWGDEPNGYDVVEYHLQVPRQWYEAGRITPLKENVFSFFPQGVEMHYLLAMELRGGPWRGMYLAQFMHAAMCATAAVAVGGAAGVIVAATPWVLLLAPIAYVEGGVLLYGTLAAAWAMRRGWRAMAVAGAMAGFACGVKLTNIPMLALAVPIAALVADRADWLKRTAAFLVAAILVLSPWLIRTALWTGNPVFPEAMNLLGHAHFSAVEVERWRRAYLPTTDRWPALIGQIIGDWRYGYLLIPTGLIAAATRFRSSQSRFLVTLLLLIAAIWLAFTHLQSRFFVLAIPILALMIAEAKWPASWTAVLACFLLACSIAPVGSRLMHYLSLDRRLAAAGGGGLLARQNLAGMRGPDPATLPPGTRLDLVGDACAFWYQVPEAQLTYRTVFDVDSTDETRSVVQDWLNGSDSPQPGRMLVITVPELQRLSRTYYQIPPLTDEEIQHLAARPDIDLVLPSGVNERRDAETPR
jgi:hypothetical protein